MSARKRKPQDRPPTKDEIAERIRKLVIRYYPKDLKHWEERYEFDCQKVGMIEYISQEIANGNLLKPIKLESRHERKREDH